MRRRVGRKCERFRRTSKKEGERRTNEIRIVYLDEVYFSFSLSLSFAFSVDSFLFIFSLPFFASHRTILLVLLFFSHLLHKDENEMEIRVSFYEIFFLAVDRIQRQKPFLFIISRCAFIDDTRFHLLFIHEKENSI